MRPAKSGPEAFREGVTPGAASECWLWHGAVETTNGYGRVQIDGPRGRRIYAHRLSWELHNGAIPEGLKVLHRCDTPLCVNPQHLFLGTQADNCRDMVLKGRNTRGERVNAVRGNSHPRTKIPDDAIPIIRREWAAGVNGPALAARYGVERNAIYYAVKRRRP